MADETCRWDQKKRAKLSCWYRELWGCHNDAWESQCGETHWSEATGKESQGTASPETCTGQIGYVGLLGGFFEEMVPLLLLRATPPPLLLIKNSSSCRLLLLLFRQMAAVMMAQLLLDTGS